MITPETMNNIDKSPKPQLPGPLTPLKNIPIIPAIQAGMPNPDHLKLNNVVQGMNIKIINKNVTIKTIIAYFCLLVALFCSSILKLDNHSFASSLFSLLKDFSGFFLMYQA